ncbi:MAG: pseudouridine synthase [Flavobacteriaceae bacterium]
MKKPNKPSFGKSKSTGEKKFEKNPRAKFEKKDGSTQKSSQPKPKTDSDEIRLNKYIANSGVCSRREADLYITSGNVKVNGQAIIELGYKVKPGDKVTFDGALLSPEKKEYILLNKPKNFSTSANATQNNVANLISGASKNKLLPIGRMDSTTTGLLLFTNDNDLITKFTQESQRSSKIYQVTLDKNLKYEDLEKIQKGITIEERKVYVEDISYIEKQPKTEIGLKVRTSNVKVVRVIFEKLGYDVLKVDRVTFAGLTKKNLPRGMWRVLTEQEVINLKNM